MKESQQNKILNLLEDGEFHCTSEMAALYMVDYRRRLVDLKVKGYLFVNRRCQKHAHPMKEWKLISSPHDMKKLLVAAYIVLLVGIFYTFYLAGRSYACEKNGGVMHKNDCLLEDRWYLLNEKNV